MPTVGTGYVSHRTALADYHRVVERFRKDYPGPWMGTGYSYVRRPGHTFRGQVSGDLKVILSSSGWW